MRARLARLGAATCAAGLAATLSVGLPAGPASHRVVSVAADVVSVAPAPAPPVPAPASTVAPPSGDTTAATATVTAPPTAPTTTAVPPTAPATTTAAPPTTVRAAAPSPTPQTAVGSAAEGPGCGPALAYLEVHAAPGFRFECPGWAEGHEAMTCVNVAGICPGQRLIAIADPCPAAYENEASNSWVLTGQAKRPIDPYGACPA